MIAAMRTLGLRTLLVAVVDLSAPAPPPPPPDEPFTLDVMKRAVEKLREMNVPPFTCASCGAQHYAVVPPGTSADDVPTRWMCDCGRINRCDWGARAAGCLLGQDAEEGVARVEQGVILLRNAAVRSKVCARTA